MHSKMAVNGRGMQEKIMSELNYVEREICISMLRRAITEAYSGVTLVGNIF